MDENKKGAIIANISGSDPDGDNLIYTIVEDIGDSNFFKIYDGQQLYLEENFSANYEEDNQFELTLKATDPLGLSTRTVIYNKCK